MDPYMTEPRPSMAKAVIIGGIVGGILGLIPLISQFNCCCCLWFAVGAIIAVLIYRAASPISVTTGHGALLGLITGLVSGLISGLGNFMIYGRQFADPMMYDPDSAQARELFDILRQTYTNAGMSEKDIEEMLHQIENTMTSLDPQTAAGYVIAVVVLYVVIGIIISVLAGIIIMAAIAGKKQQFPEEPPPYQPANM